MKVKERSHLTNQFLVIQLLFLDSIYKFRPKFIKSRSELEMNETDIRKINDMVWRLI